MPFTPFHFGPGLAIKGLIPKQFSLSMFALTNVMMDVEPLYRLWQVQTPIHGFSHTLTGAALITIGSAWLGQGVINAGGRYYQRLGGDGGAPFRITRLQAWMGAVLGSASHLLLDAVMHADMRPWLPFTDANPLWLSTWTLPLHFACTLAGMFGMVLLLARAAWQGQSA